MSNISAPAPPSAARKRATSSSFVANAKVVALLTFFSRVLGLVRESVAARCFGAGEVWSAFTFAFAIPNLFRRLLGEGALSAAFIPLYTQAVGREDVGGQNSDPRSIDSANGFANASVNLLIVLLIALTFIGEAVLLAWAYCFQIDPETVLALKLTAIMLPYVLLVCGQAFLSGILQVHHRFAAPAAVPIVSNILLIAAIVAAAEICDLHTHEGRVQGVYVLAISVLISGLFQLGWLIPSLLRTGFRFHPVMHFFTPQVRQMLRLTGPVALSAGVLQISTMADKGITFFLSASRTSMHFHFLGHLVRYPMEAGALARLNWAQYLYQFPLSIFATAVATVIFPRLSASALSVDQTLFKHTIRRGIEATLFIGLPASIGLIVVAHPATALIFQRGDFHPHDTELVARSTMLYAAAIWAFSLQQILNRAYYAIHDTKTPLYWGIVNLLINTAVEVPLLWTGLSESAMAAGTLVSFAVQSIAMVFMLNRRVGGINLQQLAGPVVKMLIASAAMLAACLAVQHLSFYPHHEGKIAWAEQLLILMTLGTAVYGIICHLLGMSVLEHVIPQRFRKAESRIDTNGRE
ncbi:MAG TPA: murein biosynthesis integral membrane protein MurJ [Tepidisphaeraceae bacterium]|jgi:putative peptidoglycan lipid II flippase